MNHFLKPYNYNLDLKKYFKQYKCANYLYYVGILDII